MSLLGLGLLLLPFFLVEAGSIWLLAFPIAGAGVAAFTLWHPRRALSVRHPWVENRPAMWIGSVIAGITILLCFGILLAVWAISSAFE